MNDNNPNAGRPRASASVEAARAEHRPLSFAETNQMIDLLKRHGEGCLIAAVDLAEGGSPSAAMLSLLAGRKIMDAVGSIASHVNLLAEISAVDEMEPEVMRLALLDYMGSMEGVFTQAMVAHGHG